MIKPQKKAQNKKLKSAKSDPQLTMPIGALVSQINQLKGQLAEIKAKKSPRQQKDIPKLLGKDQLMSTFEIGSSNIEGIKQRTNLNSPKWDNDQNKTIQKISNSSTKNYFSQVQSLIEINFPIREHQLKLNIQLNKLYREIKNNNLGNKEILIQNLNKITTYLNNFMRDYLENKEQSSSSHHHLDQLLLSQKLKNQELQQQLKFLKQKLMVEKETKSWHELTLMNKQLIFKIDQISQQLSQTHLLNKKLIEERNQIDGELKIFERTLQRKQQQILMLEEDISYNRMESEKHRNQKKQLERLYHEVSDSYKQLKNKYEGQVELAVKEKQKWRSQCETRRGDEREILSLEETKNMLKKQLEAMRQENLRRNCEINETKLQIHEEQRRNMSLEGQNYHLTSKVEKLNRTIENYKYEIQAMGQEVEDLRVNSRRQQSMSKKRNKSTQKIQAINQIKQLIQGQRKAGQQQ